LWFEFLKRHHKDGATVFTGKRGHRVTFWLNVRYIVLQISYRVGPEIDAIYGTGFVEETILVKNLCELPFFNSILPWEIITNTITGLAYSLGGWAKQRV